MTQDMQICVEHGTCETNNFPQPFDSGPLRGEGLHVLAHVWPRTCRSAVSTRNAKQLVLLGFFFLALRSERACMSWVTHDPGHADLRWAREAREQTMVFSFLILALGAERACMSWVTRDPGHADLP